jgi:prepilin-type N-terminal cleavage/methylation domain-containing protein
MRFSHPHPRSAFTLVEMLTVIIIIGLLVALLVPAIMNARIKALDTQMINEISQLDSSMKQFRTNYAVLPPALHNDNTPANTARVRAFWRRAWTRWDNSGTTPYDLSPAEVLVFYLGGRPNLQPNASPPPNYVVTSDSSKVLGFNLNPLNPTAAGGQRSTPLFQFDQGRLFDENDNGFYEYYPPAKRSSGDGVPPYAYFDAATYGLVTYSHGAAGTYGTATPYFDGAVSGKYMNADSFQILGGGLDNNYGAAAAANKTFPSGNGYINEDNDNVSNFSTTRLEDAKP